MPALPLILNNEEIIMKIYYVEGHQVHRELLTEILENEGHLVLCYLPQESLYGTNEKGRIFQNPEELVLGISTFKPDAIILDRDTFSKENNEDENFLNDYLTQLSPYYGKILITTDYLPESELKALLPEYFRSETGRKKVFDKSRIEELVSALR